MAARCVTKILPDRVMVAMALGLRYDGELPVEW